MEHIDQIQPTEPRETLSTMLREEAAGNSRNDAINQMVESYQMHISALEDRTNDLMVALGATWLGVLASVYFVMTNLDLAICLLGHFR